MVSISVIVPTRDRPALLRQALASIRVLEEPGYSFEIVVADNGTDGATEGVAQEYGARYVRVPRPGASAARNAGLELASGEFVAFLDDDDLWTRAHIRGHLALMRADSSLGAAMGRVQNVNPDLSSASVPWPQQLGTGDQVFRDLLDLWPQIGATVVRADVAAQVGRFDEDLLSDEDWDWQLRLASITNVGFVPETCVLFRSRTLGCGDLEWKRMRYLRIVLVRNVRRAPDRRRLVLLAARGFVHQRGAYAYHFAREAAYAWSNGEHQVGWTNAARALWASPPHGLLWLIRLRAWSGRRPVVSPRGS